MSAIILDGKSLSLQICNSLKERLQTFLSHKKSLKAPTLATILVGNDSASATYVRMKLRTCEKIGIGSRHLHLPAETTTEELVKEIQTLNANPDISGILLQHPVPAHIDERLAFDTILPQKDVDGVTTLGFGKLSLGLPAFPACTPAGIIRLLDAYSIDIRGKHAVVIGRSVILGRPMAMLLLGHDATVTICHSHTKDLSQHLKEADIVIAACGRPQLIQGSWLRAGVTVIDAGYNAGNVGDVDYPSCLAKAAHITPVPGGVGPMTIAMLMEHTLSSIELG